MERAVYWVRVTVAQRLLWKESDFMTTPYQDRKISDPKFNFGDEPYFEAATQGKLLVKYCNGCGQHHHYPRALCPFCFSDQTVWKESAGLGTIYSYSVTRVSGPVPYVVAYVTLDEGPTMLTNIVDCDLDSIRCGQKVQVTFKHSENGTGVPMFKPR
jgi:uncharacterized OB-fold protein